MRPSGRFAVLVLGALGDDWQGYLYSLPFRNCQTFVSEVLRKCCLDWGAEE
jgi:hypothetical protein